jgi:hypothetical protein
LATVLATAPGLLSFCCRVYTKERSGLDR